MSSVNPVRHAELLDNLPSVTEVPDGLYARRIPVLRLDVADASNLGGKDRSREGHAPNVFWQEAAELVATLCTAPPRGLPNSRALLLSQDGDELYIAMAIRNDRYQEFLLDINEPGNEEGFLQIKQWGPWCTDSREDLEVFASVTSYGYCCLHLRHRTHEHIKSSS